MLFLYDWNFTNYCQACYQPIVQVKYRKKDIGDKNKLLENIKLNKVINTLCTASTVDVTKCLTEAAQFFLLDHP